MRTLTLTIATSLALVVGASMAALAAGRGGPSAGHGAIGGNSWTTPPGFSSPGKRTGWGDSTTPPGWSSQGKRTDWGDSTMPPGIQRRQPQQ
jgi:hypothetical protein